MVEKADIVPSAEALLLSAIGESNWNRLCGKRGKQILRFEKPNICVDGGVACRAWGGRRVHLPGGAGQRAHRAARGLRIP